MAKAFSALRFTRPRSWQLGMLLLFACGAADAARFDDLYVVTVLPDASAADQRAAAEKAAFARLLVRLTGSRTAATDPQLAALIEDARTYENSYGQDRQGRPIVGFNAARVEQALMSLSYPFWGAERPLTLIWIAVDDGIGGRAMLGANDLPTDLSPAMVEQLAMIRSDLTAAADERGLPIALPLLDLEDLTAVTFADVWGGFDDRVAAASVRYRADAVLIGRVRPGVLGYEFEWLLLKDGLRLPVAGAGARDGLDTVADTYAAELATVGGAGLARLTVLDVATSADYGRVLSYLETLSVLQSVDVESFDRGVLNLRVAARGDERVLERVLALGGVLTRDTGALPANGLPGPVAAGGGPLVFRVARGGVSR